MSARPSRTAEFMALFRALESGGLIDDPFARRFLGRLARLVASLGRRTALVPTALDQRWPGARGSGVARTRLIDDWLLAGVADGLRQVVILGAGYDCRAYRLPALSDCRVFEVDRPETQAVKRERLGDTAAAVTFVPLDLLRVPLADALAAAGFDRARPTFFIWEGVTNYLTADAVDATLRLIGGTAPGGRLAFTYVHRGLLDGTATFGDVARLNRTLAKSGEGWTFGLLPVEVPVYLAGRGLELVEDLGSVDYRERYWPSRRHVGYEFYRAALANIRGTGS